MADRPGEVRAGPPDAPALRGGWLLRATAAVSVAATALGVILAPGLRGLASESWVNFSEKAAWSLAYLMCGLLAVVVLRGAIEVARAGRLAIHTRVLVVLGAGVVVAMAAPALQHRLPAVASRVLAASAVLSTVAAAIAGVRAPHTRAISIVLMVFGVAAFFRLVTWEVSTMLADRPSQNLYAFSRVLATMGVLFEALGQLAAAAWLGTRGRLTGQVLSSLAIALAFVLTWGADMGIRSGAPSWQIAMHTALGEAAGRPEPYLVAAVARFLVPSSILLALVAVVQPRQVAAVVSVLALILLSRGGYDVPLRALAAVAAAQWAVLLMVDERAMWKSLMASRPPSKEGPAETPKEPGDKKPEGEGAP